MFHPPQVMLHREMEKLQSIPIIRESGDSRTIGRVDAPSLRM
jgi:hypothetical protein